MAIIVFQHHDIGRPGRLGATLRDHAHQLDIRRLDMGDPVPTNLDEVTGVVSLGGMQSVGDPPDKTPWMEAQCEFLRAAHERKVPIVGICLGAQLLASALGGEIAPMEDPEIGFHTVRIGPSGQSETLLAGVAWESPQFCHHAQEIKTLPVGATALASSKQCSIQAFKAGLRSYGFQFHFEVDQAGIRDLIASAKDDLHRVGYTADEIEEQIEKQYNTFARLADRLCVNIAAHLMPTGKLVAV